MQKLTMILCRISLIIINLEACYANENTPLLEEHKALHKDYSAKALFIKEPLFTLCGTPFFKYYKYYRTLKPSLYPLADQESITYHNPERCSLFVIPSTNDHDSNKSELNGPIYHIPPYTLTYIPKPKDFKMLKVYKYKPYNLEKFYDITLITLANGTVFYKYTLATD